MVGATALALPLLLPLLSLLLSPVRMTCHLAGQPVIILLSVDAEPIKQENLRGNRKVQSSFVQLTRVQYILNMLA